MELYCSTVVLQADTVLKMQENMLVWYRHTNKGSHFKFFSIKIKIVLQKCASQLIVNHIVIAISV